jgi:uncharacterized protein YjbI with pentapeptide repeats
MNRRDFLFSATGFAAPAVIVRRRESWAGRDLSGLVLRDSDLAGADLRGCRMIGTDFSRVDLREARLDHADIAGSKFDGARMVGASLEGASITEASFRHANLASANMGGAVIADSWFESAEATGISFRGARFGALVDFGHAILDGTDFRDTTLSGMMMFENGRMRGAMFAGMRCLPWNHSPASTLLFDGTDARGIDLTGIKAGISGEGGCFRDAILAGTDFCVRRPETVPNGSRWTGADLSGADLRGANLAPMVFDDLLTMDRAEFRPPLFVGANLVGATLDFRLRDELQRPENRPRLAERFIDVPDTIFDGAVFGGTRINGKLYG